MPQQTERGRCPFCGHLPDGIPGLGLRCRACGRIVSAGATQQPAKGREGEK